MSSLIKKSFNLNKQTNKKFFLPANKQWVFSQYNYNKHKTKDNIIRSRFIEKVVFAFVNSYSDNLLNRLEQHDDRLKNSWSLKKLKRRLRKKTKRLTKSLKKIVIQKPEIKSTNDFLTLNLYFYNGEKSNLFRKLFLLKNSIKKVNSSILINEKSLFVSPLKTNFFNKLTTLETGLSSNNLNFIKLLNRKRKKQNFLNKNKIFKLKHNLNLFKKTLTLLLIKKQTVLKVVFFFRFLKWLLKKFGIKVYLFKVKFQFILSIKMRKTVKQIKIKIASKQKKLRANDQNRFIYVISKVNKILFHLVLFILSDSNNLVINLLFKSKYLDGQYQHSKRLNNKKLNIKDINLNKIKLISLKQDFEFFKKRFFVKLLTRNLKKEKLILTNLISLTRNNIKLSHFISKLKPFVQRISDNKQIKLNLISLKQIFLNADLATNALATKLKLRKASVLRIANKFLTMVKIASSNIFFKKTLKHSINLNRILSTNILIFKTSLINKWKVKTSTEKQVISDLKTKWIKGIKLNFSGRLTKRFKASRSLNKTNIKGSLTNFELKGNNYNVMLRGDLKSNMEHSFKSSEKHIGAFGVKGWITAK